MNKFGKKERMMNKKVLLSLPIAALLLSVSPLSAEVTRVADINPGLLGSSPRGMTVFDGAMYFSADDGTYGRELWKYDGSAVTRLSNINTFGASSPRDLIVYNDELYFRANVGSETNSYGEAYLWKYDGNTVSKVMDNSSGNALRMTGTQNLGFGDTRMAVVNNKLYFEGWSSESTGGYPSVTVGAQLWEYDAASGNAARISDIHTGTWDQKSLFGSFGPEWLTAYNGKVYMTGYQASYENPDTEEGWVGTEMWSYDGSDLTRESSWTGMYNPGSFMVHSDGKMYMHADLDGTTGSELVSFDGTDFTVEADIILGVPGGAPMGMTSFGGELYFRASDTYQEYPGWFPGDPPSYIGDNFELWTFDGTTASLVEDISTYSFGSSPSYMAEFDGKLYFAASDDAGDTELWAFDGVNTFLVADTNPLGSSYPRDLVVFDGKLYFEADDGVGGRELFVVPEPATMGLLALGGLALIRRRRTV